MSIETAFKNPYLPYANKQFVRTKVLDLLKAVRSLVLKCDVFISNEGKEYTLLFLYGTIPIQYLGATYNIPLEIILRENFPAQPPTVFVRPTSSMIVKVGHSSVQPDGNVMVYYLNEWSVAQASKSSLVELIQCLIRSFSTDPPLYSVSTPIPPSSSSSEAKVSSSRNSPLLFGSRSASSAGTYSRNESPSKGTMVTLFSV